MVVLLQGAEGEVGHAVGAGGEAVVGRPCRDGGEIALAGPHLVGLVNGVW
jgi:hypothetical protein